MTNTFQCIQILEVPILQQLLTNGNVVLNYLQHVNDPMKMKCSIAKSFSTDEDDDQMEDGEVGGVGRAVGEERTATGRKRIEITIKNNSDPESANNGALPVRIPILHPSLTYRTNYYTLNFYFRELSVDENQGLVTN